MLWEWQDQPGTARPLIADTTSQPGGRGANLKWVVDTNHLQPVGVVVRAMVVTSFLCVACRHLVVTLHWGRIISEASHAAGINVYILPPPVPLRIKKSSKVLIKESGAARENCGDHGGVDGRYGVLPPSLSMTNLIFTTGPADGAGLQVCTGNCTIN